MDFEDAVEFILEQEGGYVWDANDPGGETNWGISKRAYPDLNIKELTRDDAVAIYRRDYWDAVKGDALPPYLRLMAFDCAVNQGVGRAIRLLQKSVGVKDDGVIGPLTERALVKANELQALHDMALFRHHAYTNNPSWKYYGKGWSSRLLKVAIVSAYYTTLESA